MERAGATCKDHGKKHDRGNSRDRAARLASLKRVHGAECAYCGADVSAPEACEQDRIVASCFYTLTNLIPACRQCNASRGDRSIIAFILTCAEPVRACEAVRRAASLPSRSADASLRERLDKVLANLPH